ncbi:hypothetical protein GCM10022403_092950 [Streptomyces coacervatus]|uniref:Transposase n=1 Tax=Streptomyces coacervatus TaxID=647381 RepID=A0ABP7JLS4_9ACTN
MQVTDRYGTARAMAWDGIHPRLTTRSAWIDHAGELPVIEGTLIRLQVDRLLRPVVARARQAFLRRFDLEHTFRLMKQTLGWTRPKIRTPEAGDRWTWLWNTGRPCVPPPVSRNPRRGGRTGIESNTTCPFVSRSNAQRSDCRARDHRRTLASGR